MQAPWLPLAPTPMMLVWMIAVHWSPVVVCSIAPPVSGS
jgi:hypothetical protein